jgi:short-subunit dehydrogenase
MKTFLSIGAGPGISYATAERFAQEGFRIVLSARNAQKTRQLADRLEASGYEAQVRTVDAGDPSSVASLVAGVEHDFGSIDVLHYNVASMRKADINEQAPETFIPDLAVNIGGALLATQAVLKRMTARGSGSVLLTGGGYGLEPDADHLSLSIGKAGIRALALGLFDSLKEKGVHIGAVTVWKTVSAESGDAEIIGNDFWKLHNQPIGAWTAEMKSSA